MSPRRVAGRFDGVATFTLDERLPGRLRYVERGTLRFGRYRGPASRRLTYQVDGARAEVVFDDGRYFHDLDLRGGVWEMEHPCGDDRYEGRFEVEHADRWHQRWMVSGPRKGHRIHTILDRYVVVQRWA